MNKNQKEVYLSQEPNTNSPQLKNQLVEQKQNSYRTCLGVIGCIGGLLVHLVIGSLYQWGIINIYITSYYRIADPSVTLEANAIAFPIMMMCIGLTMRLGLFLSQATHPLIILLINQILAASTVFVASFVNTMALFIIFYGVLFGLIVGNSFMIPIVQCNKYFPGKKMYVNGFILIGTGMGSVLFGQFSYNFLNPNKLPPINGYYSGSAELLGIASQVPVLLKYLALLYLCIGCLGVAMLIPTCLENRRNQNKLKIQKKEKQQIKNKQGMKKQQQEQIQIQMKGEAAGLKQAFSSFVCWLQAIIIILASCGCLLINGNYKTYVKKTINDDQFLTIIGVIGSVGNGCTRFFWSLLFSKTGYKSVMLLNFFIIIFVLATIRFTVHNKTLYLLQVFLSNSCLGGLLVIAPTFGQAVFGQKTGSNIYGFYWTCFASANFIGYAYVSQLSKKITFDNVIYICLGMCCLAVPLLICFKFQGPWKNSTLALQYLISYEQEKVNKKIQEELKEKAYAIEMQSNFLIKFKIKEENPQSQEKIMQITT